MTRSGLTGSGFRVWWVRFGFSRSLGFLVWRSVFPTERLKLTCLGRRTCFEFKVELVKICGSIWQGFETLRTEFRNSPWYAQDFARLRIGRAWFSPDFVRVVGIWESFAWFWEISQGCRGFARFCRVSEGFARFSRFRAVSHGSAPWRSVIA